VLEVLSAEEAGATSDPSPLEVARNAARRDLARLLKLEDERDTQAEYLLRASGIAGSADAICACARDLKVELIVMGKHHLGFVEHVLTGSVAEKVVRHAPCPVLIVQNPEQEFVVVEPQQATAAH
jgi:universal stress protein A